MLIVVTNRHLVKNDFLNQIKEIAKAKPFKIILREKDLGETEYFSLSKRIKDISNDYDVDLAIHSYINVAKSFKLKSIHLPFNTFKKNIKENKDNLNKFNSIGVSTHSLKEAIFAEENNADYILVGHIFSTLSKKDLKPKGLDFLKKIKKNIAIPIYAIGGINLENIGGILKLGINNVAVMSDLMESNNPYQKVIGYKKIMENLK
jgi:thiamine-phosphate pyrophosphorylase